MNVGLRNDRKGHRLGPLEAIEDELADIFRSTMKVSATESELKPVMSLHNDLSEIEVITLSENDTFEQKRILLAISECINGNTPFVRQYLNTLIEVKLFLYGKDESGNTTLIMAAAEKSHEMVSLLLQNGADVNATNNDGRGALMEAALWGRIETVRTLLRFNADKYLRDHHSHCAMDLAQPCRENEKERYKCSSRAAEEQVFERNKDRRLISILLRESITGN